MSPKILEVALAVKNPSPLGAALEQRSSDELRAATNKDAGEGRRFEQILRLTRPSGTHHETQSRKGKTMKYGARNQLTGKVTSIKRGDVMSLIKFEVMAPAQMASVITTESVSDLDVKVGDQVQLIVKAVHVLPVKP